jgi:hypothetical protein
VFEKIPDEAETAASKGNMKAIYDITKTLSRYIPRQTEHAKDKDGKLLTK